MTTLAVTITGREEAALLPVEKPASLGPHEVRAPVAQGSEAVVIELDIAQTGKTPLDAWFIDADGDESGAYYV